MPKRPKPAPSFTLRSGESISFVLPVKPRTKKNSRVHATVRGRTVPLPSKVYRKMADEIRIWALTSSVLDPLRKAGPWGYATLRLAQPLNCAAIFYRDALRGDAVGYYQGLADALEAAGIVSDDKWITQWGRVAAGKGCEKVAHRSDAYGDLATVRNRCWCYCRNKNRRKRGIIMVLSNTVDKMLSEDYKERFIAEYQQLSIRHDGLKKMLDNWDKGNLNFIPTCPRSTYDLQIKAMNDYRAVLEARAVMENIDLIWPAFYACHALRTPVQPSHVVAEIENSASTARDVSAERGAVTEPA